MTRYNLTLTILISLFTLTPAAATIPIDPDIQERCDEQKLDEDRCKALQLLKNQIQAEQVAEDLERELQAERRARVAAEQELEAAQAAPQLPPPALESLPTLPDPTAEEPEHVADEDELIAAAARQRDERQPIYGSAGQGSTQPETIIVREIVYVEREPEPEPQVQTPPPSYQTGSVMMPPPRTFVVQIGRASRRTKVSGLAVDLRNFTGADIRVGGLLIPHDTEFSLWFNYPLPAGESIQLFHEEITGGFVTKTESRSVVSQANMPGMVVHIQ